MLAGRIPTKCCIRGCRHDRLVDSSRRPCHIRGGKGLHDTGVPDRLAVGIAHAELGGHGTALLEHARAVGVDRLQDGVTCVARARARTRVHDLEHPAGEEDRVVIA